MANNDYITFAKLIFQDGTSTKSVVDLLRENGYLVHDYTFDHVSDFCKHPAGCTEDCENCEKAKSFDSLIG